jgi:hypothetical protein
MSTETIPLHGSASAAGQNQIPLARLSRVQFFLAVAGLMSMLGAMIIPPLINPHGALNYIHSNREIVLLYVAGFLALLIAAARAVGPFDRIVRHDAVILWLDGNELCCRSKAEFCVNREDVLQVGTEIDRMWIPKLPFPVKYRFISLTLKSGEKVQLMATRFLSESADTICARIKHELGLRDSDRTSD